ncbi:MAG: hypothetical protein LM580_11350 [Thermofilum sp.]|nr:hypothetical protein [Thermofilum sp.]
MKNEVLWEMKQRTRRLPPHVKQRVLLEWDRTILQMARFMRLAHNYSGAPVVPDSIYAVAAEVGLAAMEILAVEALLARARNGDERDCVFALARAIERVFSDAAADAVVRHLERRVHHYEGWEEKYMRRRFWPPTACSRL